MYWHFSLIFVFSKLIDILRLLMFIGHDILLLVLIVKVSSIILNYYSSIQKK